MARWAFDRSFQTKSNDMKKDNVNYLVAGGVVVAALVLLLVVLFQITGRTGATESYFVYYDNVTGLGEGTPAYFDGYRIGDIGEIVPDRSGDQLRFEVTLNLKKGWPVPEGSVARVSSAGLLSDTVIDISEGPGPGLLAPGSEIPGAEGGDMFAAVNSLAADFSELTQTQIRPMLETLRLRVDGITGDLESGTPEVIEDLRELLAKLDNGAASINQILREENISHVDNMLVNLDSASGHVTQLAGDLKQTRVRADELLDELNAVVAENRPELNQAIVALRRSMASLDTRMDSIAHNLESTSRNINEFSRTIRRNPGILLSTPADDETEDLP